MLVLVDDRLVVKESLAQVETRLQRQFEVGGDVSAEASKARAANRLPNTWAAPTSSSIALVSEHRGLWRQSAHTTRVALPWLRRSSCACAVNTGSIARWRGLNNRAAYGASKGAAHALTMAMAADRLIDGSPVMAVTPGIADTVWVRRAPDATADREAERSALEARQSTGRHVTTDEVAPAICFMPSRSSSATTGAFLAVGRGSDPLQASPRPRRD